MFSAIAALAAASTLGSDARACGGCFTGGGESTIVTAHRMALSVSMDRTVLWDQIRYQGDPEEFAWVLPVKPGATVELASDAFFEALDAATTTSVNRPVSAVCNVQPEYDEHDEYEEDYGYFPACSMTGCAGDDRGMGGDDLGEGGGTATAPPEPPPPPPVEVVHEESIGPYEAVILSSNQPGALYEWLLSHGYAVDPSMEPTIDAYEADGFDFVGLRLIPGVGTRQMKPVRITTPGASPVLPLRMVAAGTGANVALTLFMIGEGRWEAESFPNGLVQTYGLNWDLATSSSNYDDLRLDALAANEGATWITTYAKPNALLAPVYNPVSMANAVYTTSNGYSVSTIASAYAQQGVANGENVDLQCLNQFVQYAHSMSKVVDPCASLPANEGGGGAGGGAAGAGGSSASGAGGASDGSGGAAGDGGAGGGGGAADGAGGGGGSQPETGAGGAAAGTGGAGGTGNPLEEEEPTCLGPAGPDTIDARHLICGDLDDIAVALVGMRPGSVWVTRLEANLPRAALEQNLSLRAAASQSAVENWLFASTFTGDPCEVQGASGPLPPKTDPRRRPPFGTADMVAMGLTLALFLLAAARRQTRGSRAPALGPARASIAAAR